MSCPEIGLQVKIVPIANGVMLLIYRQLLGVLKSKDKCNLTSLYHLIAFFAALLACAVLVKV
jgi:hypothetical protein